MGAWSAALLPTGDVLLFQDGEGMYLYEPGSHTFRHIGSANTDLFCAGLTLMADGKLLAVGGHGGEEPFDLFLGLSSAEVFDPWSEVWEQIPDMVGGERWYPTALTLADGRVLVASGTHRDVPNETLEILDPLEMKWTVVITQELPMYPWAAVAPQGDVVFYGPQDESAHFDLLETAFTTASYRGPGRWGGTGVILDAQTGRLLAIGGGEPTTQSVDLWDPSQGQWRPTSSMSHVRHHPDSVLLPDGTLLVVGGHSGHGVSRHPVREEHEIEEAEQGEPIAAEVFDPVTETWQELAISYYGHGYHSTALLLPDGSVMAAGPLENLEIYQPWYFYEERPEIASAPEEIDYGQSFLLKTSEPSEIS
ncbi:MAG: Kelch repeat-containing protein, partial [Dehalococcoidia bacterium]